MITVTTRAKDALLQIRAAANIEDPEIAMRLEPEESGFGLAPDTQKPGDKVVSSRERPSCSSTMSWQRI